MNPTYLLNRLEAEGVSVSLNLKATANEKLSDDTRALIRDNRDALLEHLIAQANGTHVSQMGNVSNLQRVASLEEPSSLPTSANLEAQAKYTREYNLHLYGDLLHSLCVWIHRYYELRLEHPNGLTLDAKPDHVRDAVTQHLWGVLYTDERHVLLTWGDVPASALLGKRDLLTGEPLVTEQEAA